jgi:hypothetical protein
MHYFEINKWLKISGLSLLSIPIYFCSKPNVEQIKQPINNKYKHLDTLTVVTPKPLLGTKWRYTVNDTLLSTITINCDSTYINYDSEIETNYYGYIQVKGDSLFLYDQTVDNPDVSDQNPEERLLSHSVAKLLRTGNRLVFISRDGEKFEWYTEYHFLDSINCKSFD